MTTSTCSSCGASINWAVTEGTDRPARLIPLDVDPLRPRQPLVLENANIIATGDVVAVKHPRGRDIEVCGIHRCTWTCP